MDAPVLWAVQFEERILKFHAAEAQAHVAKSQVFAGFPEGWPVLLDLISVTENVFQNSQADFCLQNAMKFAPHQHLPSDSKLYVIQPLYTDPDHDAKQNDG